MKETFIKSTIILMIGGLLTKILGMVIRIVNTRLIGLEGISLYMLVFPTLTLFTGIAQFSMTTSISKLVSEERYNNKNILSSALFIILFLSLACCRGLSRKVPYNYLFLFAITICEAISCSITSSIYSFQIVASALLLTIVSTLAITFYAFITKNNFNVCRIGLYVIFSQMFAIGIIAVLFRIKALYVFYTFCKTIIIGIYLVYDTQLIIGKLGVGYSIDDYIFATLEIYMDIIRLFLLILKLIGNNSRRN
jgi:FtsH-binding integral membrane protein